MMGRRIKPTDWCLVMPERNPFKQVDEKHVSAEVTCMQWSPKMDLIAVANIQAEVSVSEATVSFLDRVVLYRLSWQKVWTLAAPCEDCKVMCLAWRNDGKVIAVSYDTGKIQLCDVENACSLHTLTLDAPSTTMCWVAGSMLEGEGTEGGETTPDVFQDMSSHYLPRLPTFAKGITKSCFAGRDENVEDSKRLKGQKDLNILVVGTEGGHLHLYAYGVFPVGQVDVSHHGVGKSGQILHACLSEDLYMLSLLLKTPGEEGGSSDVYLMSFDTTLLASRHTQLQTLALKFGQLLSLMRYLHTTIEQMQEAWEDILLEMDSKLQKFAEEKNKVCGGSVSNDFLQLLMYGIPSDELQVFLLHDLTEKGLKKLGHSIETSYSNIQKLVLKHLHSVGLAIVYHLEDIRGMSLWYDKFGILGLSTASVQDAIAAAGSFMLKASELQQVIDGSMKNLKAFFWWLYVVIQQLSDEPVPPELSKMTEQDLNFVAHFLKENFTEEVDGKQSGFKLEKVGQYLKNEELHDPPDGSTNPWVAFLEQNPKLQESPLLYRACPSKSLIQMHDLLRTSVDVAVQHSAGVIGESLQCVSTSHLFTMSSDDNDGRFLPRVTQFSRKHDGHVYMYTAFTCDPSPCEKCYILRQKVMTDRTLELTAVTVGQIGASSPDDSSAEMSCSQHQIVDLAFYDHDTLSMLLAESQEDGCAVLLQLPLAALEHTTWTRTSGDSLQPLLQNADVPCFEIGTDVEDCDFQRLEHMKAAQFAVSGTRKVACVLFASRRRVRLFLMEAEEEEEEDEDEEDTSQREENITDKDSPVGDRINGDDDENKENSGSVSVD